MIVRRQSRQSRPETIGRRAAVETGDNPHIRLAERGNQTAQIVAADTDVTVGNDNDRVANGSSHVDEIGDLTISAMLSAANDQLKIEPGISLNERFYDRNCAVIVSLHPEDDLNFARIIVVEIGLQVLGELRFGATQRLRIGRPAMSSESVRRAAAQTGAPRRLRPRRTLSQKRLRR